ncbi:hypothetical protein IscW_ISCW010796 [Ixodes scapularis]|uniref:Uncharacterized protein n=1 Tax=Ixodes scapularis TaxID=6945 RepID=B7Q8V2_IXOSC|nr:hypothetical protein IscW_ISCW010796 [Ixodes scapularis]|eukprot:XP_002405423.1 hypothetical protein IscW_ISCW010796 [Ixodes scapularis]
MTTNQDTLNACPRIHSFHALMFCGNIVIVGALVWALTARSPASGNGPDAAISTTPTQDITYRDSSSYVTRTGRGNGATSWTGSTVRAMPFHPDYDENVTYGERSRR